MTFSDKSILLTGSTGFLGAEVCRIFEGSGLKILKTQGRANSGFGENYLDIASMGIPEIAGRLKTENCLATFHFATDFSQETDPTIAEQVCAANLVFAIKVAEASALAGVANFLNIASTWEWLRTANSETSTPFPPYSASKQAFRTYLDHRFGPNGFVKNLVIEESLGEGDSRPKLIPSLIRAGLQGEVFSVRDPDARMNFADSSGLALFLLENLQELGNLPYVIGYADFTDLGIKDIVREIYDLGISVQTRSPSKSKILRPARVTLQSLGIPIYSNATRSLRDALAGILFGTGFEPDLSMPITSSPNSQEPGAQST